MNNHHRRRNWNLRADGLELDLSQFKSMDEFDGPEIDTTEMSTIEQISANVPKLDLSQFKSVDEFDGPEIDTTEMWTIEQVNAQVRRRLPRR